MARILPTEITTYSAKRWYRVEAARLFEAYQDPDQMLRWFGPANLARWLKFEHDLRPGGGLTFGFSTSDGEDFWGRCDFIDIDPGRRIEYVSSITDPDGSLIRPLPGIDWSLQVHTVVSITPSGDGTFLHVTVGPHRAGLREQAFFAFKWPEMKARFETSFDTLEALLGGFAAPRQQ